MLIKSDSARFNKTALVATIIEEMLMSGAAAAKVTILDKGVKLVCNEPSKPVKRLVFCQTVIEELAIVREIKCRFGNQAAKTTTIINTDIDNTKYFDILLKHWINHRLESGKRLGADDQISVYFPIGSGFTNHKRRRT